MMLGSTIGFRPVRYDNFSAVPAGVLTASWGLLGAGSHRVWPVRRGWRLVGGRARAHPAKRALC